MSQRERERYVKAIFADILTDGAMEAEYAGKLTRAEASFWYQRIGNLLSVGDLLPQGTPVLKDRIKQRLASSKARPKPKIPGPRPGEDVASHKLDNVVVPFKRTGFGAAAIAMRKVS